MKVKLQTLAPGKILFPAEGEGRNAVFAARLDWDVAAFDLSEAGKNKAEWLANKNQVQIEYVVSDVENIEYPASFFDALALIYAHFPSENRKAYHQKLSTYLKSGGVLILEAFSKQHSEMQKVNPQAGGPKNVDMLYDLETIKSDFEAFDFIEASAVKTTLSEGNCHLGEASVIRIFAIKK